MANRNNSTQLMSTLDKAQEVLGSWSNRALSLTGKVLVVNTLIASLYVYVMQCVCNPTNLFFQWHDTMIKTFLWGSRNARAKVPYDLLQADKKVGRFEVSRFKHKMCVFKGGMDCETSYVCTGDTRHVLAWSSGFGVFRLSSGPRTRTLLSTLLCTKILVGGIPRILSCISDVHSKTGTRTKWARPPSNNMVQLQQY